MNASNLIDELIELTFLHKKEVTEMKSNELKSLNYKPDSTQWSALECIEHLNRYGKFYIPEIRQRLTTSTLKKSDKFKTGLLGNYFAKSMLPKEKLNKMKTFKNMDPTGSNLDISTLDTFINDQEELIELLEKSRETDLTKIKTSISISNWIKLRLGDTFRVVIYHNKRHILQAKRAINPLKE